VLQKLIIEQKNTLLAIVIVELSKNICNWLKSLWMIVLQCQQEFVT